jgi:hypothetical protein
LKTDTGQVELTKLLEDLQTASALYREALAAEEEARQTTTRKLKRLNEAQAAFDEAYKAVRGRAPGESDWGRPDVRGSE